MSVKFDNPRKDEYKFYIAAKDSSGNYSESTSVTVEHPGIQQLDLQEQDVQGLLSSLKIKLPKVMSDNSQTVYPFDSSSEEKEILGYRLHIQEVDYDTEEPTGDEEIIDYEIDAIGENRTIFYQAETGKKFAIRVGAYDSVYHPDYNPSLYNSTKSEPAVIAETFKVEPPDVSEALIEPNDLTTSLQNWDDNLEEKITLKAGKEVDGEKIVGGIGLAYNSTENDIDVQVVADRFRLFDPDVEPDGTALFAVGTVDGTSQIFLNANEITIAAHDDNEEYTDGNFFVLNDEGLRIYTDNFKLDKSGNAIFNGEVSSTQFSLEGSNMTINENGITANEFELDDTDGSAIFKGELEAATGTFGDELSAVDGNIRLIETDHGGVIEMYHSQGDKKIVHLGNRRKYDGVNDTGVLVLSDNNDIGKVAVSISEDKGYGYITLANSEDNEEPLTSTEGLFLRGGTDEEGDAIFLRTSYNHGMDIGIRLESYTKFATPDKQDLIEVGQEGDVTIKYKYDEGYGDVSGLGEIEIHSMRPYLRLENPSFQNGSTSGTADDLDEINDGNTNISTKFSEDEYVVIELDHLYMIRRYRFYIDNNSDDGKIEIHFYNNEGLYWSSASILDTKDISKGEWSDWDNLSHLPEVLTNKIRIKVTDCGSGEVRINEAEFRGS